MKKAVIIFLLVFSISFLSPHWGAAQCSICTKTAQQLGEKPAKGLNGGILYLAFAPFLIAGYVSYRWWKSNRSV